jgi:pyruvate formate lyase activating enzyme
MSGESGIIFDIQHFSVHDGPGIRSTIFFKGCPLSCKWCSNPESQARQPQLFYFRDLCTACGTCIETCQSGASEAVDGGMVFRRDLCAGCGACVAVCPQDARTVSGRKVTVEQVCDEVRQHWQVFMSSGGGITCGGGEALAQPAFLAALLGRLHDDLGFHTCLDTSGYAAWPALESLLPSLDLILLDLKHMDGEQHRRGTGRDNRLILDNARRLAARGFPFKVRVPLIPGFNDGDDNIHALGGFLRSTGGQPVELLPYHEFGRNKYAALEMDFSGYPHSPARVRRAEETLGGYGLDVTVSAWG